MEGKNVIINLNMVNQASNIVSVEVEKNAPAPTIIIKPKSIIGLSKASPGQTFKTDAGSLILLEHLENGVAAVISKDIITKMVFGDNNSYRESKVKRYLDSDYMPIVVEAFGVNSIVYHKVSLMSGDGLHDYGISEEKVSLLAQHQYQGYREFLPPIGKPWWLSTPYSTPSGVGAGFVLYVGSDGGVCWDGCGWCDGGVRPFLNLDSSKIFGSLEI